MHWNIRNYFVYFALIGVFSYPGLAFGQTPTCGGVNQPICEFAPAARSDLPTGPNAGEDFNLLTDEFVKCPAGYNRSINPDVNAPTACHKPAYEQGRAGTWIKKHGCAAGTFGDPNGRCYSCPSGYYRTLDAVTAGTGCAKGVFGPFAKPKDHGIAGCAAGSFLDVGLGACYSCGGWNRSAHPVTHPMACTTVVAERWSGISSRRTAGCAVPDRVSVKDLNACWTCPENYNRSVHAVNEPTACTIAAGMACNTGLGDLNGTCVVKGSCGSEGGRLCNLFVDGRAGCDHPDLVDFELSGVCKNPPGCGGENQSACTAAERPLRSCDTGFAEFGGKCESCGADGQKACPVLALATLGRTTVCDRYLGENSNGICEHPECGRLGDKACVVTERLEACDSGLIDAFAPGMCFTKNDCGGTFERACNLSIERTPSCDEGLVEDIINGVCVPSGALSSWNPMHERTCKEWQSRSRRDESSRNQVTSSFGFGETTQIGPVSANLLNDILDLFSVPVPGDVDSATTFREKGVVYGANGQFACYASQCSVNFATGLQFGKYFSRANYSTWGDFAGDEKRHRGDASATKTLLRIGMAAKKVADLAGGSVTAVFSPSPIYNSWEHIDSSGRTTAAGYVLGASGGIDVIPLSYEMLDLPLSCHTQFKIVRD